MKTKSTASLEAGLLVQAGASEGGTAARPPAAVLVDRRGAGGDPRRRDDRRRRRRGARERRRPDDGGGPGDPRGRQLHDHARPRAALSGDDAGPARRARDPAGRHRQLVAARNPDVRPDRRQAGGDGRVGPRARDDDPRRHRSGDDGARPRQAGPRLPAAGARGRHPRPGRPHRGGGRSGPDRRPGPGRRDLRDHQERRDDGAGAGPDDVRPQAQAADHHHRRPDPLPDADRAHGDEGGDGADAHRARRVRGARLSEPARWRDPRGARQGRPRLRGEGAAAGALEVPDRRRLPLGPLRLRRAAPHRDGAHRPRRAGRAPVPEPGGAGHRPGQQDPGLPAAGPGARHRRGQRAARVQGRISGTTASAPRSSGTWGSGRCGC